MSIKRQLMGAFVSALVALPLALAFGVASGLGAEAGVLAAVIAGSLSALMGGTAGQHSGPTGAVAVLLALSMAHFAVFYPDQPDMVFTLTLLVVVMSGAIQIFFGWMHWGRLVELLPHSVISGLLTAIGLMLVLEQLPALLGGENAIRPLDVLIALPDMVLSPAWAELLFGLLALVLMVVWPKYLPKANRWLPAPILVLVSGGIAASLLATQPMTLQAGQWWLGELRVIGALDFSLPSLHLPQIEVWQLPYLVQSAFTLAVVASLISLLGSVVAERLTRQEHDPDRELIGQGIGNIASGLFGGMASTGAPMRTTVAMSYGSRDAWAAAMHALLVGVFAWLMSDLFAMIPLSVLGGMLIKVGLDQVDWSYIKRWHSVPKAGRGMMLAVLLTAMALDLITAVLVGLAMASVVLLGRMTQLQLNALHLGTSTADLPLVWFSENEKALFDSVNQ
ncbi:MAG: SulP family inorganic anion transporter, partial [Thiotrichales bacterium]|nr:SulP family inorganic anion transporter [Thiotrichales bacterium]